MKKRLTLWIPLIGIISILILSPLFFYFLNSDEDIEAPFELTNEQEEIIEYYQENSLTFGVLDQDEQTTFILTHIGDYFDLEYSILVYSDFPSMYQAATEGTVDFIGNISYTEAREEVLDFSSPTSVEDIFLFTFDLEILNGQEEITIAIPEGTIYETIFESIYENVNYVHYTTVDNFFEVVLDENVDGAISNMIVYERAIQEGLRTIKLNEYITISPVSIVTQKGKHQVLLSAFSAYISSKGYQEAVITHSNEYIYNIYFDYIQTRKAELFGDEDIVIHYKLEDNPPYTYWNDEGEAMGIYPDLIEDICGYIDATCIIENEKDEMWSVMFNELTTNEIDMLGAISYTDERAEYINFSDRVIYNNNYMYHRRDFNTGGAESLTDLIHERIGVQTKGSKTAFLQSVFPNKEFIYYDHQVELIEALSTGAVDYILFTETGFLNYMYESGDYSMIPNEEIGVVYRSQYSLGFQYNERGKNLAELFSIGLQITDLDSIKEEHIKTVDVYDLYEDNQIISRRIIIIMSVSISVLIVTIFIYVYLFRKLQFRSRHDNLTGTFNREFFEFNIQQYDNPKYYPLGIVVIDLNGLKLINDAFGHAAGDQLLIKAVELLNENLRSKDVLGRIGGDEFAILLPNTSDEDAHTIMRNVQKDCEKTEIHSVQLSLAYGIYSRTNNTSPFYEEFKIAEDEMYRMKLLDVPSMRTNAIETMLTTLYEKDQYSQEHSSAVSTICERLAIKMGFNNTEVNDIKLAGMLHDIGKIIIPDEVLKKTGKLTDYEYLEIKKHSEIGYRILSSTKDFRKVADFVLSHHEHFDGNGYPQGLKGDEIPIQARIISIADAFEAMTSYRTYRPNKTFVEALTELKSCSGTQFDPKIVKIFANNYNEITRNLSKPK